MLWHKDIDLYIWDKKNTNTWSLLSISRNSELSYQNWYSREKIYEWISIFYIFYSYTIFSLSIKKLTLGSEGNNSNVINCPGIQSSLVLIMKLADTCKILQKQEPELQHDPEQYINVYTYIWNSHTLLLWKSFNSKVKLLKVPFNSQPIHTWHSAVWAEPWSLCGWSTSPVKNSAGAGCMRLVYFLSRWTTLV